MNALALATVAVQVLRLLNVGIAEIQKVWDMIRHKNPNLPEMSTAQIAAMAEGKFSALLERIADKKTPVDRVRTNVTLESTSNDGGSGKSTSRSKK